MVSAGCADTAVGSEAVIASAMAAGASVLNLMPDPLVGVGRG
jgi:hypothetical protein